MLRDEASAYKMPLGMPFSPAYGAASSADSGDGVHGMLGTAALIGTVAAAGLAALQARSNSTPGGIPAIPAWQIGGSSHGRTQEARMEDEEKKRRGDIYKELLSMGMCPELSDEAALKIGVGSIEIAVMFVIDEETCKRVRRKHKAGPLARSNLRRVWLALRGCARVMPALLRWRLRAADVANRPGGAAYFRAARETRVGKEDANRSVRARAI